MAKLLQENISNQSKYLSPKNYKYFLETLYYKRKTILGASDLYTNKRENIQNHCHRGI